MRLRLIGLLQGATLGGTGASSSSRHHHYSTNSSVVAATWKRATWKKSASIMSSSPSLMSLYSGIVGGQQHISNCCLPLLQFAVPLRVDSNCSSRVMGMGCRSYSTSLYLCSSSGNSSSNSISSIINSINCDNSNNSSNNSSINSSNSTMRLSKFISSSGKFSRVEAEKVVKSGRVTVDGKDCLFSAVFVSKDNDVRVDGQRLVARTTTAISSKNNSNSNTKSSNTSSNSDSSNSDSDRDKSGSVLSSSDTDDEKDDDELRLSKFIANTGVFSRAEAERAIREGRVKINGEVIRSAMRLVDSTDSSFVVSIDDVPIDADRLKVRIKPRLWLVRKHTDELVADRDLKGRPLLFDRIPQLKEQLGEKMDLKPVLRHDYNTEGLCVFTNNGDFARYLQSPESGFKREYRARVHGLVTKEKLFALQRGVFCENQRRDPIETYLERTSKTISWLRLSTSTMDNRVMKSCLKQLHLQVTRFVCTKFGPFKLEDLLGPITEIKVPPDLTTGYMTFKTSNNTNYMSAASFSNARRNGSNSSTSISSGTSTSVPGGQSKKVKQKRVSSSAFTVSSGRMSRPSRQSRPRSMEARKRLAGSKDNNSNRDRDRDRDSSKKKVGRGGDRRKGAGGKSDKDKNKSKFGDKDNKRQFTVKKRIMMNAIKDERSY